MTEQHDIEKRAKPPRRESLIAVIGLGSLLSSLLIYSVPITAFQRFTGLSSFIQIFAETSLAALMVISLFFAALALCGKSAPSPLLISIGGAGYLCGIVAFLFFTFFGEAPSTLVAGAAVASTAGNVALCLVWARIFARFDLKLGLINVSLASIFSAAAFLLLDHLPEAPASGTLLICAIVAVSFPAAFKPSAQEIVGEGVQFKARKALDTFRSLSDVVAAPVFGLLFFAFVMGALREALTESFNYMIVSIVLVSALLIVYALSRKQRFGMRGLHQTFIPIAAMILLSVISITSSLGQGTPIAMFLIFFLYTFAAIMALATLSAVAHAGEFSSDLIFSSALFLFGLTSLAGMICASNLPGDLLNIAVIIVTTVYAFAMVLLGFIRRQQAEDWELSAPAREKESTEERCRKISEDYHLTARESEILGYLAAGHTGAYISEVLFISPNTARTHIHNIYRKLDITSREDVLRLTHGS